MFIALMRIREKQNPVSDVNSAGVLSTSLLNIWAWALSSLYQKLRHDVYVFESDGGVNGTEFQKNIFCQTLFYK